jgi:hypothetical protein
MVDQARPFLSARATFSQRKNGMPIKDIFFPMISYPVSTSPVAVENAMGLAVGLQAQILGLTFEINIRSPVGIYADLPEISEKLDAEAKKSVINAHDLVALFTDVATRQNAKSEHSVEQCMPAELSSRLAEHARLRDLTIFPLREADQHRRGIVEAVIFESGRPILLLPEIINDRYLWQSIASLSPGIMAELLPGPSLMVCLFCKQPSRSISLP